MGPLASARPVFGSASVTPSGIGAYYPCWPAMFAGQRHQSVQFVVHARFVQRLRRKLCCVELRSSAWLVLLLNEEFADARMFVQAAVVILPCFFAITDATPRRESE